MSTTHTLPRADSKWLDDLAHAVAEFGIDRHEPEIRRFANELRCTVHDHHGARVMLAVLVDVTQPAIARERAFGRLHGFALATPTALHLAA
jgi:hypothetical protein